MKSFIMQNSLNSGELSPFLKGRTDIPRYLHGLETCRNFIPLVTGGITRRPGQRYVATAKDASVRLIPFRDPADSPVGYVLELGNLYMRVYHDGEQVQVSGSAYEIVTPWLTADLNELRFVQSNLNLYVVHKNYAPYRISHKGLTSWDIEPCPFGAQPFSRPENTQNMAMALSGTTGTIYLYAGMNTISSNVFFDSSKIGNIYRVNGYRVQVTEILLAYKAKVVIKEVSTIAGNHTKVTSTYNCGSYLQGQSVTVTVKAVKTADGDNDLDIFLIPENMNDLGYLSQELPGSPNFDITTKKEIITESGKQGVAFTVKITMKITKPSGDNVSLNFVVSAQDRSQNVAYTVSRSYITDISSVTETWSTTTPAVTVSCPDPSWSQQLIFENGTSRPTACAVFEQRLWLAASKDYPTTIWASKIGDPTDFTAGALADSSLSLTASDATMGIRHLVAAGRIFQFAGDREITVTGEPTGAITVTNVQIATRTTHGSADYPPPVDIVGQTAFFTPSRQRVRVLSYRFDLQAYVAPDVTIGAEHLLADHGGAVAACYAREPYSTLWMTTTDGTLISLTYDRDQDVIAWAQHGGEGTDKCIAVTAIPDRDGIDQVWTSWQRTLNGEAVTTIEYMDPALFVDAGYSGTDVTGKTAWTGLAWLKNEVVDVVADGTIITGATVDADGTLTLTTAAQAVTVGKRYVSTATDLPLDLGQARQTTQGANVALCRIRAKFHKTIGGIVQGSRRPQVSLTGDYHLQTLGRGTEGDAAQITIQQDAPVGMTLLAIIKELSVNG